MLPALGCGHDDAASAGMVTCLHVGIVGLDFQAEVRQLLLPGAVQSRLTRDANPLAKRNTDATVAPVSSRGTDVATQQAVVPE